MMGRLLSATAATLLLFTLPAHADTKSWAALKGKVPAGANVIVSVDVSQIAKTAGYATAVQAFLDEEEDAKMGFQVIKSSCGVDVTTVITDVTIMGIMDVKGQDERALIALGVNGVDKAKLTTCMQGIADLDSKGAKLSVKTKGKVTEYSVEGKSEKFYIGWLTKDVVVFTSDPDQKGVLEKMLKGKAPKGDIKTFIGKTSATAAVFFGVAKTEDIENVGKVKGAYGTVDLASGSINVKATVVTESADAATKVAAVVNTQVKEMATQVGKQLPDFAKALGATTATVAGSDVTVSGSITEKVLVGLIPQLDKIF